MAEPLFGVRGGKALRSTLRSLASAHKPHSFLAQNNQSCPVPQPK